MAKELKVFCLRGFGSRSDGFTDEELGRHRQIAMIVAAPTKKKAQELFGCASTEMRYFSSETQNKEDVEKALSRPEQVFARPNVYGGGASAYRPIFREPHVPTPRRKRAEKEGHITVPRVEFTVAELTAIRDRFAMANDPDGQAIAEKANRLLVQAGSAKNA